MRFSVLTITYNAAKYLAETLQSVKAQEGVNFEHILWDGGSQDNTLEIARSFTHVKIFAGKDSGIADAMNKAAALASGDFLLHLHADDLLAHSQVLLMFARALNLHKQAAWAYGKAHIINEKGEHIKTTPFETFSAKRMRKYNFISHPATVVSRDLFLEAGGFNRSLRYCMDYDLWLRLSLKATPLALNTPLACFREHRGSLSTKESIGVAHEAYKVRNNYVNSLYERYRSFRTWKKRTIVD